MNKRRSIIELGLEGVWVCFKKGWQISYGHEIALPFSQLQKLPRIRKLVPKYAIGFYTDRRE
jgi:hypothetical protein